MGDRMRRRLCRGDWTRALIAEGLDKPRFGAAPGGPEPDTEGFGPDEDDDHPEAK